MSMLAEVFGVTETTRKFLNRIQWYNKTGEGFRTTWDEDYGTQLHQLELPLEGVIPDIRHTEAGAVDYTRKPPVMQFVTSGTSFVMPTGEEWNAAIRFSLFLPEHGLHTWVMTSRPAMRLMAQFFGYCLQQPEAQNQLPICVLSAEKTINFLGNDSYLPKLEVTGWTPRPACLPPPLPIRPLSLPSPPKAAPRPVEQMPAATSPTIWSLPKKGKKAPPPPVIDDEIPF